MNRFTFTAATLAVALGVFSTTSHKAEAAITSLDECYDAVLTWCNETYPNMDCSNASGLDDCDEVFGDNSASLDMDRYKVKTPSQRPRLPTIGDGNDSGPDAGREPGRN